MGCSVIIERTHDSELVKRVCFDPAVWETIAEDGISQDEFEPDMNECWLTVDDGQLIGLYNLHPINSVTLQIHPMILPQFRGSLAYESGKQVLKWIVENTDYQKVFCFIPEIYRNVILFAMRCGLAKEGKNRRSHVKNGKIHDMVMLGITRQEIEATLWAKQLKRSLAA